MAKVTQQLKKESIPMILALIMSTAGFVIANIPYQLIDQNGWLCIAENTVRSTFGEADDKSDAYFINTGYDKQLVGVAINAVDSGKAVITDRKALLDLLNIAEKANYKYLFMDIRFEKGYETEWDKALFAKIASMRDIICSTHYEAQEDENGNEYNQYETADSALVAKSAYNDYKTTVFSNNFSRYPYLQDNRASVALRMYQDIDHKTMTRWGPFYRNDGRLCENCPYIPIKGGVRPETGDGSAAEYQNLGSFVLEMPEETIISDMEGKIVIVGDFNEDIHDTYMGYQPGPYLTYAAYKYLAEGKNDVSWTVFILLTITFYIIVRAKLKRKPPIKQESAAKKHSPTVRLLVMPIIKFVGIFISYSLFFSFLCTIIYLVWGTTYNIAIASFILTCISADNNNKDV